MKVVDQVPMPRARTPQVDPAVFAFLVKRVDELEKKVLELSTVKRGRPSKTEDE